MWSSSSNGLREYKGSDERDTLHKINATAGDTMYESTVAGLGG